MTAPTSPEDDADGSGDESDPLSDPERRSDADTDTDLPATVPDASSTLIEWRDWGPAPFEEAAAADRPVLLYLTARWCTWCGRTDATVWADPTVAANVHDSYVPVRVNADRRPDVRERYQPGGFPGTVFLAPDGRVLAGVTYVDRDDMRTVLERVRAGYRERGASDARVPEPVGVRPPAGSLDAVVDTLVERVRADFDDEHAGWGTEAKFPLPRTIEFALWRAPRPARRTLAAVRQTLFDAHDGGFGRYAAARDWTAIHHERLTDEVAAVARAFLSGHRAMAVDRAGGDGTDADGSAALAAGGIAHADGVETVALAAAEYLTTTLWIERSDGTGPAGAFAAAQAGGPYFTRSPADRSALEPPPIDHTVIAGHNALAIDACLRIATVHDAPAIADRARTALATLTTLITDGRVARHDGADAVTGLAIDQARTLRALTTAVQVLGPAATAPDGRSYLTHARAVADWTLASLADAGEAAGGPTDGTVAPLRDRPATATRDDAGLLARPLYPLEPTAECADALIDLGVLTDDDRYRAAARALLVAFGGVTDRLDVTVAGYGTAVARVTTEPTVVRVADRAGSDLHQAAWRGADHETVIVPAATAPPDGTATVDGADAPPTTEPAALGRRLRDAIGPPRDR